MKQKLNRWRPCIFKPYNQENSSLQSLCKPTWFFSFTLVQSEHFEKKLKIKLCPFRAAATKHCAATGITQCCHCRFGFFFTIPHMFSLETLCFWSSMLGKLTPFENSHIFAFQLYIDKGFSYTTAPGIHRERKELPATAAKVVQHLYVIE